MPASPLTFAFVMDPLEGVDIAADTTFVLMLEAQRRGHRVLVIDPDDLGVCDGRPLALARAVTLRREAGNHCEFEAPQRVDLDADTHVVLQRKDPPVDAAYVTATQILGLCRRTEVLNRPSGILAANEKLYACRFPELMTDTLVSRNRVVLLDFMAKLGGEMILKPLDGKGGEGIFHVHDADRNLYSLVEQATGFGRHPAMAQRYLPAVREGDKRILLVDGEPIGAVLRVPAEAETRSNLHVGGHPARASLDADDERIVATLAPHLRADGLFFVGIDVIGGKLTEVNVTSPTGVQEVNALDDTCLETRILDGIEAQLDGKSA
jgi:glutathione synthase